MRPSVSTSLLIIAHSLYSLQDSLSVEAEQPIVHQRTSIQHPRHSSDSLPPLTQFLFPLYVNFPMSLFRRFLASIPLNPSSLFLTITPVDIRSFRLVILFRLQLQLPKRLAFPVQLTSRSDRLQIRRRCFYLWLSQHALRRLRSVRLPFYNSDQCITIRSLRALQAIASCNEPSR